jgi:hypothetical protein
MILDLTGSIGRKKSGATMYNVTTLQIRGAWRHGALEHEQMWGQVRTEIASLGILK